jgi:hypothetical protein
MPDVRRPTTLLALLVLAGCGSDGETATAPAEESLDTFEIVLTEFRLEPPRLAIDEPGVYTFRAVNRGSTEHALEIESEPDNANGDFKAEIGELGPGERAELIVRLERGLYEIECPVADHDDRGMKGLLSVGETRARTSTDGGGSGG